MPEPKVRPQPQTEEQAKCPDCGAQTPIGAETCPSCQATLGEPADSFTSVDQVADDATQLVHDIMKVVRGAQKVGKGVSEISKSVATNLKPKDSSEDAPVQGNLKQTIKKMGTKAHKPIESGSKKLKQKAGKVSRRIAKKPAELRRQVKSGMAKAKGMGKKTTRR